MAEPITLYKLMILSMLDQSEAPLTNTLLSDFFLGKEYTTYFTLQEALHELDEAQFIRQEASHSNVQYSITPAGQESLRFFEDKINSGIQADIKQYIADNQIPIAASASAVADYYMTPEKKYAVHCQLREKGIPQLDLTINVLNKAQAEVVCANWKKQTDEIYMLLIDHLLK
ncbi:MAG: DUF4364 family protein [Eubacterium sp.]|nr:DUF4364 family protein [Eubacterium sp.]